MKNLETQAKKIKIYIDENGKEYYCGNCGNRYGGCDLTDCNLHPDYPQGSWVDGGTIEFTLPKRKD